jgi:hypothetical protein
MIIKMSHAIGDTLMMELSQLLGAVMYQLLNSVIRPSHRNYPH